MWSAIEEFESDISACIRQQTVVAHPETVLGIVAARVPRVHGSHSAGIGSDEGGERKDPVAVLAAAGSKCRNQGMAEPREYAFALATVIQSVFLEGLCERIARGRGYAGDAEGGAKTLAVGRGALFPLRRGVRGLVESASKSCADEGIRAECVE